MESIPTLDELALDANRATSLSPESRSRLLARCAAVLAALSAAATSVEGQRASPPEPEAYLRLADLVKHTGYGNSTIRSWAASGFFRKGKEYIGEGKKRRYLMRAIQSRLAETPASNTASVTGIPVTPFVRKGRRHG